MRNQNKRLQYPLRQKKTQKNLLKVDAPLPNWRIVKNERDHCTAIRDECSTAKCCKITGYRCFAQEIVKGKCSKYSGKGQPYTVLDETMTLDVKDHATLYCFAVYTEDTGDTKTSSELEPLKLVYKKKASILHVMNRLSSVM